MARERLDYAAIGDTAAAALDDHLLKLGLERLQPKNESLDLLQLAPGNMIGGFAGPFGIVRQVQQLADGIQRES
jgi:hypothetical protein